MRLVSFYASEVINPVVINKSKFLYRLDILKPDSVDLTALQNGKSYSEADVLTSVLYDGFANTRFIAGPQQLFNKIITELTRDVRRELLMELSFNKDFTFSDGSKLRMFGTNSKAGTSTKIKGITYTKSVRCLITEDTKFYRDKVIKTLEFFKDTKKINFDEKDYQCLYTKQAVIDYVNSEDWSKVGWGSVDTETTGVRFHYNIENSDEIVGMSHSYKPNSGVFIQFRYKGDQLLDVKEILEIMQPILQANNVYQNGSFDYRVFRHYDVKAFVFLELTDILQLINSDPDVSKALKPTARLLLGEDTIELDEILGTNFDAKMVEFIDRDLITFYACGDTDKTLKISKMLYEKLPDKTKELLWFDSYNYREVCIADWYGFPVDKAMLNKVYTGVVKDKQNAERYILDYLYAVIPPIQAKRLMLKMGVPEEKITDKTVTDVMSTEEFNKMLVRMMQGVRKPEFELDYGGDRQKILYDLLEYPKIRYTKGGMLSTSTEYFKDLCNYELATPTEVLKKDLLTTLEDVDEQGERVKLISKDKANRYAFPMGYMLISYAIICNKLTIYKRLMANYSNGRTFDTYRYTNTATGRLSSSIHTIAGYAKAIIGHVPDSNFGILSFDADQIELRGVHNEAIRMWDTMMEQPEIANDKDNVLHKYSYQNVIDIFNDYEADPHTEMAALFNHVSLQEVTPLMRKRGKTVAFSGTYGAFSKTMAKGEMALAKTEEEKQAIAKSYSETKDAWLDTNLHLLNYFETTQKEALRWIPKEEIPFNCLSEHVGRTTTRSGRSRYYDLDDPDISSNKIGNRGRNQYIQSYCRDIIFVAIQNLSKALRKEGLNDEVIRSILFVHDEDGLEYDKTKINPLWLAAMVFKYCCIEIEGHKIKYYVTPAIVNNWGEGKTDKYEIPKKMLAKLSTNKEDYPLLDTLNHRDYILQKIHEYYTDEMVDIFEKSVVDNTINADDIDTKTRYQFFKRAKDHTKGLHSVTGKKELDILFNYVANSAKAEKYADIVITVDDTEHMLSEFKKPEQVIEDGIEELDLDLFESFDSAEEFEEAQQVLSNSAAVHTSVNKQALKELDKKYSKTKAPEETAMLNIIYEKYMNRATIFLDENSQGSLDKRAVQKINSILLEVNNKEGIDIQYYSDRTLVQAGVAIPKEFCLDKFDKFITSLRK